MIAIAVYLAAVPPVLDLSDMVPALSGNVRAIGASLGLVGALVSPVLLVGMVLYVWKFSESRSSVKMTWFVFIVITASFGASVYYFCVYRRMTSMVPASD